MLTAAPPMTLEVQRAKQARGLRQWLRNNQGAVVMAGLLAFAGPLTFFTGALSVMRLAHEWMQKHDGDVANFSSSLLLVDPQYSAMQAPPKRLMSLSPT